MTYADLLQRLQGLGPLVFTEYLASGHHCVTTLTDPKQQVHSFPQPLANALNLVKDGSPLRDAIQQLDMHIEACPIDMIARLNSGRYNIIMCDLSQSYALVSHGMFVYYVDTNGKTFTCWSESNDRNSHK